MEKLKILAPLMALEYNLNLLVIFGSQVSGHTHEKSDIDIGFLSDINYGPIEIVKMQMDLEQRLAVGPVELVDLKTVPALLLKHVALEGNLLYEKRPHLMARLQIYGVKRTMEAKKLLDLRHLSVIKFLQTH